MSSYLTQNWHKPVQVSPASEHKHLGLLMSGNGTWQSHIENMTAKAWKRIKIM